jgi:glycosyltransferase involved in cell wall biosynthesis
MNQARVSVVISTYNRKDLLKRAIRSVLSQSIQDLECIVVDDCSTQDVETLVRSINDPRLVYIRTKENSGHDGLPKNLGIAKATGEYVAFLDDDDVYRTDALKILLAYARESTAEVVYGDYLIDGKPGWSLDFSPSRLAQMNFISMSVAMVKRSALMAVGGFDQDVPKFKDWNLWLRLQKWGASFIHIPIIITEVSQQKDSVSNKFGADVDEMGRFKPTYFNPADCRIYPDNTLLGERKPLRVAVYTLTMNRLEYTKQMVKSIEERAGHVFDWFVIDQGSTDGTQDWLKSLTRDREGAPGKWREKLRYKLYQENVGLAKGWNNIVKFIKSEGEYDIIVKVDNDAELLTDGWLEAMVGIYERNRRMVLSPYVEGLDGSPGGVLRQRASGDSPYSLVNDRVLGVVPNVGGIVFATPIELWNEWVFDEAYEGNKDMLLCQYARKLGYHCFYMEEFRVWHIDGTKGQHAKYPEYFKDRSDFQPQDV